MQNLESRMETYSQKAGKQTEEQHFLSNNQSAKYNVSFGPGLDLETQAHCFQKMGILTDIISEVFESTSMRNERNRKGVF